MNYKLLILLILSFNVEAQTRSQCLSNAKPLTIKDQHLKCFKIAPEKFVEYTYDPAGQISTRKFIGFSTIQDSSPMGFMTTSFNNGVLKELYSEVQKIPRLTDLFFQNYLLRASNLATPNLSEFDGYWSSSQKESNKQLILRWEQLSNEDKARVWTGWDFFRLFYSEMIKSKKTVTEMASLKINWFVRYDQKTQKFSINDASPMIKQIDENLYRLAKDAIKKNPQYQNDNTEIRSRIRDQLDFKGKFSIQACNAWIYNNLNQALNKKVATFEGNEGGLFLYDYYNLYPDQWIVNENGLDNLPSKHEFYDTLGIKPVIQDFVASYLITQLNTNEYQSYRNNLNLYLAYLLSIPSSIKIEPVLKSRIQKEMIKKYEDIIFNATVQATVDAIPCVL